MAENFCIYGSGKAKKGNFWNMDTIGSWQAPSLACWKLARVKLASSLEAMLAIMGQLTVLPCLRPAGAPPCLGVHTSRAQVVCVQAVYRLHLYIMCKSRMQMHMCMCKCIFCTKCWRWVGGARYSHALLTECAGIPRIRCHRAVAPTHRLKAQTLVCARLFCRTANWRQREPACGGPLVFIQRLHFALFFQPSYTRMFNFFAKFVFNTQDHL